MKVLFLTALEEELDLKQDGLKLGIHEVVFHNIGIGKVNACMNAATYLNQTFPDLVVNLGTVGSNSLVVGEVVWCNRFIQRDFYLPIPGFEDQNPKLDFSEQIKERFPKMKKFYGDCGTGDTFVDFAPVDYDTDDGDDEDTETSIEKGYTKDEDDPSINTLDKEEDLVETDVFDMEAYAIGAVCIRYHIPFISIKYVSDNPGKDGQTEEWLKSLKGKASESLQPELQKIINGLG